MNNNKKFELVSLVITVLIVVCGAFATWFMYTTLSSDSSKNVETKNNVEINTNVYEQVTSPQKFGSEISPNEEGYGRANPFAPYK